ncbi:MAG: ferritin-like domain-containing protein [Bacteroidota bacterium]
MAEKMIDLEDLLFAQLCDLYSAETQLIAALPDMAEKATDKQLVKAIKDHLKETEGQKKRLDKAFKALGKEVEEETCLAMQGLIKEAKHFMKQPASPEVRDAGIIAIAQKVEHYEISGYGTAANFAEQLGHSDVASLLRETEAEESAADSKLTQIATGNVNLKAEHAGEARAAK